MKKFLVLVLTLLIALTPATVLAQAEMPVIFCGNLDSADCDLLVAAAEADETVTNGAYDVNFDFLMQNIPDLPAGEVGLTWAQTGRYTTDREKSAELVADIEVESPEDFQDPAVIMQFVNAFLASSNTEQIINLKLSDVIVEALSQESDVPIPAEIGIHFLIVDGVGYVNLEDLAAYVPQLGGMGGWFGTDLAPFLELAVTEMLRNPDAQGALMAVGGAIAAASNSQSAMAQAAMSQAAAIEEFVTIERLDDEKVGNESAALFQSTFDFAAFASSPAFMEMVKQQVSMMESMGAEAPSEAELAEMEETMTMVAPMLFQDLIYNIYQYIGLDSGYTRRTEVTMEWDMTTAMAMAAEESGETMPDEAPLFDLAMSVDTYDQNETEIEAPAGAFVIPAQMLMSSMQ